MVRFADFIKDRHEIKSYDPSDTEGLSKGDPGVQESQIYEALSETQIQKIRGGKVTSPPRALFGSNTKIGAVYRKFWENALEIRNHVEQDGPINPLPVLTGLHDVIAKDLIEKLYQYAMCASMDSDDLIRHTIDVTFTALMVGKGMPYDVRMQLKLGLAAFLENVGMYRIPARILKKGPVKKEEITTILDHPKRSYDILSRMGEKFQWLAEVALQVHERSDGSGYPYGLTMGEIYELSSIIGLVDTYIAMIGERPYREKLVSTNAIRFIVEDAKNLFPLKIRKVFLKQISLFPVNTLVRLNNKSIGRVLATDHKRTMRPLIEILYDGDGNKLEKRELVSLSENPLLYITGCVDDKELP